MNFIEIAKKTQEELKAALSAELKGLGYNPISADGYLYAEGSIPVLLVAHMDTVHAELPKVICESSDGNIVMSPTGIGGDDRCGVYMVLEIIKELKCHVLFTEDEEKGCIGSGKFVKANIKPEVHYCIQFDRKNGNDSVYYSCDNKEFEEFINAEGFKTASGSCSDISKIAPHLGVAAVNLSCGYYNPHNKHEYVNIPEMEYNIMRAKNIISKPSKRFIYVEKKYEPPKWTTSTYNNYYSDVGKYYTPSYYSSEDTLEDDDTESALWSLVYEDPDFYATLFYEQHTGYRVNTKQLISLDDIIDITSPNRIFSISYGGEKMSIYEFIHDVFCDILHGTRDIYIDDYSNVYILQEDDVWGIEIAVETDATIESDKDIMYYPDDMIEKTVMDEDTFSDFKAFLEEGVFDDLVDEQYFDNYIGL